MARYIAAPPAAVPTSARRSRRRMVVSSRSDIFCLLGFRVGRTGAEYMEASLITDGGTTKPQYQAGLVLSAAVVGSIIFFTSVIFVAGNPLISACFLMLSSSFAR